MTTQIRDALVFRGVEFAILDIDDDVRELQQWLVNPWDFGMTGEMTSTANRRGCSARFELSDDLRLVTLWLAEKYDAYRPIQGVSAINGCYEGLSLAIEFSGRLRIVRGSNNDPGAPRTKTIDAPPYPYAEVHDLALKEGRLISNVDPATDAEGDIDYLVPPRPPSEALKRYLDAL